VVARSKFLDEQEKTEAEKAAERKAVGKAGHRDPGFLERARAAVSHG
jgi:hypothetical protein